MSHRDAVHSIPLFGHLGPPGHGPLVLGVLSKLYVAHDGECCAHSRSGLVAVECLIRAECAISRVSTVADVLA